MIKKIATLLLAAALLTACVGVEETLEPPPTTEKTEPPIEGWTSTRHGEIKVYQGQAIVEGWIEDKDAYVDDIQPHFHIISGTPLPTKTSNYRIRTLDEAGNYVPVHEDIINELRSYPPDNPATIEIDAIIIPHEGSPQLSLVQIVK